MKIVEKDFVAVNGGGNLFDLVFYKKVKNKETGELETKCSKPIYGITLSSLVKRVCKYRVSSIYENENPVLLDYLNKLLSTENEILNLLKESPPEEFDTGE